MIYLPNNGKRGRMLICFLPNMESIRGALANPMHFHSLGDLASEEPSESGRNVRIYATPPETSSSTEEFAPFLQRNRRRQQDLDGESCVGGR